MSFTLTRTGHILSRKILRVQPLSGGRLSAVKRLFTTDDETDIAKETVFAEVEARMLTALAGTGIPVLQVLGAERDLLLLSDVPAGGKLSRSWGHLAEILDQVMGRRGTATAGTMIMPSAPRRSSIPARTHGQPYGRPSPRPGRRSVPSVRGASASWPSADRYRAMPGRRKLGSDGRRGRQRAPIKARKKA